MRLSPTIQAFVASAAIANAGCQKKVETGAPDPTESSTGLATSGENLNTTITCNQWVQHEHGIENISVPPENTESYVRITKWRVYFDKDIQSQLAVDQIHCSYPGEDLWVEDCAREGGVDHDYNGGTHIEYIHPNHPNFEDYDSKTTDHFIEWQYGINQLSQSPVIAGYNEGVTNDERDWSEALALTFNPEITSGKITTIGDVRIKFSEYDQNCGDPTNSDCWEAVAEDLYPETTGYHWGQESDIITTKYKCKE
jgi:hypothetical protein